MAVVSNGTTLIDNGILDAAIPTGKMTLIKTLTASSSATLSFIDGTSDVVLDDTYDEYVFKFYDIHPATDGAIFQFQGSTDGGSSYGVTITSTYFRARHNESSSTAQVGYDTSQDLAQSTNYQILAYNTEADNDQCCSGTLQIFNPSSTTFVKHFISRLNNYGSSDYTRDENAAGYFNTTTTIDAIQFKFASGNIDSGVIKLYGIGG